MWEFFKRKRCAPTRTDGSPETIATIAAEFEHEYRFTVDHARVGLFLLGVAQGNGAASELRPLFADWIEADWRRLAEIADSEIMLSWITHRLTLDALGCPENVLSEMQTKSTLRRKWNRVIGLAAIELWKKLNDSGVYTTILKGAPLSLVCYGQEDLRDVRDIDLLVSPADAFRSAQILTVAGYRCEIDNEWLKNKRLLKTMRQISLRSLGGALEVDLHWKVANDWVNAAANRVDMQASTRSMAVFGRTVTCQCASTLNVIAVANLAGSHSTEIKACVDVLRLVGIGGHPTARNEHPAQEWKKYLSAVNGGLASFARQPRSLLLQDLFEVRTNRADMSRACIWFRNILRLRTTAAAICLTYVAISPTKKQYSMTSSPKKSGQ